MKKQPVDYLAYIAYAVLCLAWGSTYLAIRIGVADMPILLFGAMRFISAGVIMLAFVVVTGQKMPRAWEDLRTVAITALLLLVLSHILILWAEQYVPSGMASLVLSATPLFVAVIDGLVPGGYKIGVRGWSGLIIGFSGVAGLLSPGNGWEGLPASALLALVVSSIVWASGTVYSARKPVNASLMAVAALETLLAGLVMGMAGLVHGDAGEVNLTANAIWALVLLIVVGSIMGYTAFVYVMEKMPPSIGMTYSYINPIVAVILGAMVLNETVTLGEIASFAVILTGVILTHSARFKTNNVPESGDNRLGFDGSDLVAAFTLGEVQSPVGIIEQDAGRLVGSGNNRSSSQAYGNE